MIKMEVLFLDCSNTFHFEIRILFYEQVFIITIH